jgi:hypothetical protein
VNSGVAGDGGSKGPVSGTWAQWQFFLRTFSLFFRAPFFFFRALPILVLFLVGACGGAQFDGVEYRDNQVAFRLGPTPAGATQLKSDDAKVAFQDPASGATVAVSARCGLDPDDVPLGALVQHLFLQMEDRSIISEASLTLDGRAALENELTATLDGVRRHFVVTVLKKDGCVYDFVHVDGDGADPRLIQSRQDFRTMVRGFRTL